jgi:hypothetical protein
MGQPPANWPSLLTTRRLNTPASATFGLGAIVGTTAFGQVTTSAGSGIGRVDLDTGATSQLTTYVAGVSGLGAMAADGSWVVWEQLDSVTDLSDWSVHAWNLTSGTHTVLATARPPGAAPVPGQQPIPVLHNGTAAWAQPVAGPNGAAGAQVWVVDLATGQHRVLDSGLVSSPVYAGGYLVWARSDPGQGYSLHGVDGQSLAPVALPAGLLHPGSIGYLAGSPDYLVWSSQDTTTLTAYPFHRGTSTSYASNDGRHFFQFLQVSGHYLVWYAGATSALLDLTTGAGFDLPGTVAATPQTVAVARSQPPGGPVISHVAVTRLPSIATCH